MYMNLDEQSTFCMETPIKSTAPASCNGSH
jgi:hypothetical protein